MVKKLKEKILSNNKNIDKVYIYTLSFLLPLILMLLVYIAKSIYPFGDKTFLRMDLYHQYLPFHAELQYKLQNMKSLLYTYNVGLGTNFLSLFAYYLSCPLNILLFLIDKKHLMDFLGYITIIKIALSSFTFSFYLTKKYKIESYIIVVFSIFYAMSGYIAAYYWNIMWLDNIVLFPLLLLGFERIFYCNDARLYIIILALSIICNYYIATLTCLFLILYFVFLLVITNQNKLRFILKKLLHIGISSIIGIFISCILLYPVFMAFSYTASNDFDFPRSIYEFFPILDVFARHLMMVKIENGVDHWPNIYCGVLSIALCIYYFLSKKVNIKRKIIVFVTILIFMSTFCVNIVNFILHVLRYPNSLPARYSFVYIAFILCISFFSVKNIKNIDKNLITKSFIISILLIIVLQKVVENPNVKFESFVLSIIFLIIYMILFLCYLNKKYNKIIVSTIIIFTVCLETFINMYSTSITTVNRAEYIKRIDSVNELKKYINSITNDFYRVEIDNRKTKDDGAFYNFPSASIFSSSCYKSGSDFYEKMGMEASMNAYSITGSTPFMDSFLNVKYELYDKKIDNEKDLSLRLLKDDGNMYLYENINTLPLSFVLNNTYINKYDFGSGNPATAQNNFARVYDNKILLEPIQIQTNGRQADFTVDESGDYYAFVLDKSIEEINYQYKNTNKKFEHVDRGFFLELGYIEKGETCGLRNDTENKDIKIQVFKFRYDNFKTLVDKIKNDSSFEIISYDDININYKLRANVDGKVFISIPYDDGWKIRVDGVEVNKEKIFDSFLGFNIKSGEHQISLSYFPKGLAFGIMLSILGIFAYILYCIYLSRLDNYSKS